MIPGNDTATLPVPTKFARNEYGPRLNESQARAFTGMTPQQLKSLRRSRAVRFYRVGHRTVVYDRDSLAAWLAVRVVEPLCGLN
jgi:hypothetical protein